MALPAMRHPLSVMLLVASASALVWSPVVPIKGIGAHGGGGSTIAPLSMGAGSAFTLPSSSSASSSSSPSSSLRLTSGTNSCPLWAGQAIIVHNVGLGGRKKCSCRSCSGRGRGSSSKLYVAAAAAGGGGDFEGEDFDFDYTFTEDDNDDEEDIEMPVRTKSRFNSDEERAAAKDAFKKELLFEAYKKSLLERPNKKRKLTEEEEEEEKALKEQRKKDKKAYKTFKWGPGGKRRKYGWVPAAEKEKVAVKHIDPFTGLFNKKKSRMMRGEQILDQVDIDLLLDAKEGIELQKKKRLERAAKKEKELSDEAEAYELEGQTEMDSEGNVWIWSREPLEYDPRTIGLRKMLLEKAPEEGDVNAEDWEGIDEHTAASERKKRSGIEEDDDDEEEEKDDEDEEEEPLPETNYQRRMRFKTAWMNDGMFPDEIEEEAKKPKIVMGKPFLMTPKSGEGVVWPLADTIANITRQEVDPLLLESEYLPRDESGKVKLEAYDKRRIVLRSSTDPQNRQGLRQGIKSLGREIDDTGYPDPPVFPTGSTKLLTFEMDGVLLHKHDTWGEIIRDAFQRSAGFGCRLPCPDVFEVAFNLCYNVRAKADPNFGALSGMPAATWWYSVLKETVSMVINEVGIPRGMIACADDMFDDIYYEHSVGPSMWARAPYITKALMGLQEWKLRGEGPKMGVIADYDGRLDVTLDNMGLSQFFDFIINTRDFGGTGKPDKAIFDYACELAGVQPHEAAHVGNTYKNDVLGCLKAGWQQAFVVKWYHPKLEQALKPARLPNRGTATRVGFASTAIELIGCELGVTEDRVATGGFTSIWPVDTIPNYLCNPEDPMMPQYYRYDDEDEMTGERRYMKEPGGPSFDEFDNDDDDDATDDPFIEFDVVPDGDGGDKIVYVGENYRDRFTRADRLKEAEFQKKLASPYKDELSKLSLKELQRE